MQFRHLLFLPGHPYHFVAQALIPAALPHACFDRGDARLRGLSRHGAAAMDRCRWRRFVLLQQAGGERDFAADFAFGDRGKLAGDGKFWRSRGDG